MLDIKFIRQEPELSRKKLEERGESPKLIEELLGLDESRRAIVTELEQLQAKLNASSKEIGILMGKGEKEKAEEKKNRDA